MFAAVLLIAAAIGADIDPIKIALLVDGMASRGSSYDAAELHALGPDALAAVLNHLLPDTAPPPLPPRPGPPDATIVRLIAQLDANDYKLREAATEQLIEKARRHRPLLEEALKNDSLEIRLRAERVLASWEPHHVERLSAYLSGFWTYLEGISDAGRLDLLANRTLKAFEPGMPEGDRLHVLRLCIAGVAHGRHDPSCNLLRPLVRHQDDRVATLVAETAGAYKTDARFVPQLLVDALASEHTPVVEAALRFVLGSQDEKQRQPIRLALQKIFHERDEALKFQACLPLMRDFHDPAAWLYVLDQTASPDSNRVRTALNWIGDTKNTGQRLDSQLATRLQQLASSPAADDRKLAAQTLGCFAGENTIRDLLNLLADSDAAIWRQAEASLTSQPDRALVRRLLSEAAARNNDPIVRNRATQLLGKLSGS